MWLEPVQVCKQVTQKDNGIKERRPWHEDGEEEGKLNQGSQHEGQCYNPGVKWQG